MKYETIRDHNVRCFPNEKMWMQEFTLNEVIRAILKHLDCKIEYQDKAIVKPNLVFKKSKQ